MSRTYRSIGYHRYYWITTLEEMVEGYEPGDSIAYYSYWSGSVVSWRKIDPKSTQYKKALALQKRDRVVRFKEPGPSWFRNLFEERPMRRHDRREIQRFMLNESYEPLIDAKSRKRIYWT